MPKKKKKEKPALLQKLINLKNKDTKAKQDPPSPPTALKPYEDGFEVMK